MPVYCLFAGGIPICWPQFSDLGPIKSQHGFARNTEFALIEHQGNFVRLRLSQSEIENKIREDFPYSFVLEMDMRLEDDQLTQTMRVMNTCMEDQDNEKARLQFTAALHTYFSLEEGIESAVVEGLQGTTYLDSLDGRSQQTEREECIRFTGEVDRIYCNTPETIRIRDGSSRCFRIQKTSTFPDAVVWNPAVEKSAKMADFGDEEWKNMVCIEVAHAGSGIVEIGPGEVWEASQSLYLES